LTTGVLVRALAEPDWPAVHEIVVEVAAAGETYAMDVPATVADTRAFWADRHLVVAEVDGFVLQAAKMGPNRSGPGAHVATASFLVAAGARGRGVGRALLAAADEALRGLTVDRAWLVTTNENLAALALYQKAGYRLSALRPGSIDEIRRTIKPTIPEIASNGIPIRDELELTREL